jgi:GNAT superfamily N-acetyltransferase
MSGIAGTMQVLEVQERVLLKYAAGLLRDFPPHQRRRYVAHRHIVDRYFDDATYARELSDLTAHYGPPGGCVLLAMEGEEAVGAVCLRRLDAEACEMKRLFVPEQHRGKGIAKALVNALFDAAVARGYRVMRLDTGSFMTEALALYTGFGFVRISPYYPVNEVLARDFVFMEKTLIA